MAREERRLYSKFHVFIIINLPKTKKFGSVGRGDLTSLFKSCEIDRSQGRLV